MNHYLETLKFLGGYYTCPKDSEGKRLGPLVGYAGSYIADDGTKKNFVGDTYVNFAKADEHPDTLKNFAFDMNLAKEAYSILFRTDAFCGAPIGGYSYADMLGLVYDRRVIKAEKKVIAVANANEREKSALIFGRHSLKVGERVAIIEDVCNNFSTTESLIDLIARNQAQVTAIICFLNRSLTVENSYDCPGTNIKIPVISLVRQPINEYKQDDPVVAEDIAKGNVIWKPKDSWDVLEDAMEKASVE